MRAVRERFGVSDFVDVSPEAIRFVHETEAQVSFVILFPGGHQIPSKGYAVVDDRERKAARVTYADHVGRIGVSVPPPE
ncbi:MAG: hypothetical protein QOH28_3501 [Actinomycetota bacterium]|nr:hypothetical protein [Actinomycetota bacterium]